MYVVISKLGRLENSLAVYLLKHFAGILNQELLNSIICLFHQFVFVVQVKGKFSLKGEKHSRSKKTPMLLANLGPSTFFPF